MLYHQQLPPPPPPFIVSATTIPVFAIPTKAHSLCHRSSVMRSTTTTTVSDIVVPLPLVVVEPIRSITTSIDATPSTATSSTADTTKSVIVGAVTTPIGNKSETPWQHQQRFPSISSQQQQQSVSTTTQIETSNINSVANSDVVLPLVEQQTSLLSSCASQTSFSNENTNAREYEAAPANETFLSSLAIVLTHLVSLSPAGRGPVRRANILTKIDAVFVLCLLSTNWKSGAYIVVLVKSILFHQLWVVF